MRHITHFYKLFFWLLISLLGGQTARAQELGAPAFSSLTWTEISSTGFEGGLSIGLTKDKRVFTWGTNTYSEIHTNYQKKNNVNHFNSAIAQKTPYYVPLPAGEKGKKVRANRAVLNAMTTNLAYGNSFACLTESGKFYAWGVNQGCYGVNAAFPIVNNVPADTTQSKRLPVLITIPNETTIVDFDMPREPGSIVVIGESGKAYFNGNRYSVSLFTTTFTAIPFPSGVDNTTFKYTNVWFGNVNTTGVAIYLKGNNNNIYVTGRFESFQNSGSLSAFTNNYNVLTDIPQPVLFPAGEDIIKISAATHSGSGGREIAFALSASGKAYATGTWYNNSGNEPVYYFPLKTVPPTNLINTSTAPDSNLVIRTFQEMPLPAGIGATKFIDVVATSYNSHVSGWVITDNNYVYWSGYNDAGSTTIGNYLQYVPINDPRCSKTAEVKTRLKNTWQVESFMLRGAVKIFPASNVHFVTPASGRGYVFGQGGAGDNDAVYGVGKLDNSTYFKYPTPLANEQLDNCNTSPGVAVSDPVGPVLGVGAIDCSKTKLSPAPVAGVPSQLNLQVSINVTTAGSFSPLSVSGSGMSLGNGITSVSTTTTGVQTFHIPIQYDGSTLTNAFQFTIGQAGSCTADLTKPPVKAITDVWTLECLPSVGPALKK